MCKFPRIYLSTPGAELEVATEELEEAQELAS